MKPLIFFIFFGVSACTSRHNPAITTLDLSNKKLTAIPDSVFSLDQLQHLQLGNRFTSYPPLSSLGEQHSTDDSMNKITIIPNDIIRLRHLRTLGFCFNDLKTLPDDLIKLENLDTLDISFNYRLKIKRELSVLQQMKGLKYLNIMATGTDDDSIDELRKLLPKTKIYAKLEDIKIDAIKTSE